MKVRTGFVSNSSSSSFIVAFDKAPASSKDIMKVLFPGKSRKQRLTYCDYEVTYGEIADQIFDDCNEFFTDPSGIINKKVKGWDGEQVELGYEYFIGYFSDYYKLKNLFNSQYPELEAKYEKFIKNPTSRNRKMYDEYYKSFDAFRLEKTIPKIDSWFKKNEGKIFYKFRYSDNGEGELGIVMEHGGVFKNVPHVVENNH